MNTTVKIDGKAKEAKATTNSLNKISYSVVLSIVHYDDKLKRIPILEKEVFFTGGRPIDCRKAAFNYAFQCIQDARIDGTLCKEHIDTIYESQMRNRKNFTSLALGVLCHDKPERQVLLISVGRFTKLSPDRVLSLAKEFDCYNKYGYETEGCVKSVKDEDGETRSIMDYRMADAIEIPPSWTTLDMTELSKTHRLFKSKDGEVHLMPNSSAHFEIAASQVQVSERMIPDFLAPLS